MRYEIRQEDINDFIRSIGAETRRRGDELELKECPFCRGGQNHDLWTFSLNTKTGAACCQRMKCDWHGHFVELCRDLDYPLKFDDPQNYKKLPQPKQAIEPTETAVKYMKTRGISEKITRLYEVTTKKDDPNILVWLFKDESGVLTFIKYRKTNFDKARDNNKEWSEPGTKPILFGMNHCVDRKQLVMTEGQIDTLSVAEAGVNNAVSVPTGATGFKWADSCREFVESFAEIVVFGDCEKGKVTLADKIREKFPTKVVRIVRIADYLGEKDANDILRVFGPAAVRKAIEKAEIPQDVFDSFDFYTVPDLSEEDKRPPEFIIDSFLPCGLTFLAGAPKIRKSFFALQLAISVATGTPFFWRKVTQCDVVYLDLEGSKNRISTRAEKMSIQIPRNVFIANNVDQKLSDGLVYKLRDLHRQRPSIRLIIIDTYSRARGNYKGGSANAYDQDVAFLEPIQRMAIDENIAIMFVHHEKKGAGYMQDSFERISGTMGIAGSADCVMNLVSEGKRFEGLATLEVNPRDAVGSELKLSFDGLHNEWTEVPQTDVDLTGNPLCKWILDNLPGRQQEGKFFNYADLYLAAFHMYSDKPADIIREQLEKYRTELFMQFGVGIQMGVKSHGNRGIRVINLL